MGHRISCLFAPAVCLLLAALLPGCGIIDCPDASELPPSQRLPGHRTVSLQYGTQPAVSETITCERYYDAQCSARGNYWATREVGTTEHPSSVKFMTITDPALGRIEIARPSCELFKGSFQREFNPRIAINGDAYFYARETEAGYVFLKRVYAMQKVDPSLEQSVTLQFTMRVNGVALHPPKPVVGVQQ